MSSRFNPLSAPQPHASCSAPLVFPTSTHHSSDFLACCTPFSAWLQCSAPVFACLCHYVMSALPAQLLCSVTWYYYIDTYIIRYAPNPRIWHLQVQKFSRDNTPGTPRRGPPPALTPTRSLAVRGCKCPRCWDTSFQKHSPKSEIATTPLSATDSMAASHRCNQFDQVWVLNLNLKSKQHMHCLCVTWHCQWQWDPGGSPKNPILCPGRQVVRGGRTNCCNNIVPNCALLTLEVRPLRYLAKMRKNF